MRIEARAVVAIFTAAVSLLTILSLADARAAQSRGPETVGNMKRIIVPEKGEPQTVIAPKSDSQPASPSSNARAPRVSNPVPSNVPVQTIIAPALKRGGPASSPLP